MTADATLREHVAAIKHDLAKYVAWRSANFDDAAWTGPMTPELEAALRADILETKGDDPAWAVWDRFVAELGDPLSEPELKAAAEAVEALRACEADVRAGGEPLAQARPQIRAAQGRIRSELRDLHRRLAAG